MKEIQNVLSEFNTELSIDRAISGRPSYDISIPTDIWTPAAPRDPDVWPPPTPVEHKLVSDTKCKIRFIILNYNAIEYFIITFFLICYNYFH